MQPVSRITRKWRPPMALVVALVCVALVSIPLAAMLTVQLTSNQFVRETEQALMKQGAIYAEIYRTRFEALGGPAIGPVPDQKLLEFWNAPLHPMSTKIDVRHHPVLPPLPNGDPVEARADARHDQVVPGLGDLSKAAGRATLAGVIFLDHQGVGAADGGLRYFTPATEVQTALAGDVGVSLRTRDTDYDRHPLASISRDTGYRVFVAYPVLSQDRVIGVVLLSRTPLNLPKFIFRERDALLIMGVFTLSGALLLGYLLLRLMSRPIHGLRNEARAIAAGDKPRSEPLRHYGVRELADLGESMLSMADTLDQRSQEIATYTDHVTHELKSPVTSISGAAELLQSDQISPENRAMLLDNIRSESGRMNTLLTRLREMTQLRQQPQTGPGDLAMMLPDIDGLGIHIAQPGDTRVPLSNAHGEIILLHMAQNALAHGAQNLHLRYQNRVLRIWDDGDGISEQDAARLTDPFFTTRRAQGGTGMGLAIVAALLEIYGARLHVIPNAGGAVFEIRF
ncbi:ATP-binding protein [Actibacterium sp. XHP0104]|uniref:ATP-binding protein n=1 Tax=Actibacterium sp. XHP0104 TaxID=2984335 RepID=UPI0021E77298|nr:ATP-binding protein [Actibacterium sp. XHP0104]MCV2882148.1 ATP-binding protein [Actibacterium sp. XHP0104]